VSGGADLPPLKETLAAIGLRADKRFGQHFLFDLNLCRKIARLAGPLEDTVVLEVGPGPGGLTRALLEAGARVIAVEKDARFAPILGELATVFAGRLVPLQADALDLDEAGALRAAGWGEDAAIIANLPYNVGTPLLVKWLTGPWRPSAMTLMFQKEVARRIIAPAGGQDYGRLSVLAQATCRVEGVLDVPARAFTPPPKVDSAVIRASPRADAPGAKRLDALQKVTAAAFGQRRKMLRSSLRTLGGEALCHQAGIEADARAEVLSVAQFLTLADAWLDAQAPASSVSTKG
jgi:16S rRNA (adenine1518-N6/adenine1519-N6)-dimethyltransferase